MSATMFSPKQPTCLPPCDKQKTVESRIPVPASPTPLRRQSSLRVKGETENFYQDTNRFLNSTSSSRDIHPHRGRVSPENFAREIRQCAGGGALKRGGSFMERGEKRDKHGDRPNRPNSVKIASKPPIGRPAASPQSPARLRSLSLSLSTTRINNPKSPTISSSTPKELISPGSRNFSSGNLDSWDCESITSIGSSVASCDHASIARNGTTFSGRSMKYVFHCNQHGGQTGDEYLTPTQRAHRQVKKLKYLLHEARKDLEQKDSDILKLTREVVELRLYKAALSSPEDKSQSNSSDAITVRENNSDETTPETDFVDNSTTPNHHKNDFSSCADSGHFEDGTNSSVHSKDSILFDDIHRSPYKSLPETSEVGVTAQMQDPFSEQSKLVLEYEKRIQELVKTHEEETYHLKQKHNDKVEELLQRITEINTRYWEFMPELETARERIRELEQQLEDASKKLEEQEAKSKETYLQMYSQGQEAARLEHENSVMELARQNPSRVSVPELLQELQVTKNELEKIKDVEYASSSNHSQPLLSAKEALSLWVLGARKAMYRQLMEAKNKNKIDPEITLQFLKSAVYYFLTDKENSQGHLKAIESILGFTSNEISNIDRARLT